MLVGFIVYMAVGILCIVLGLLIWKKQKIELIHDYHHTHVKKADIPAYTRMMGVGLLLIGVGSCLTGIIDLVFDTAKGMTVFLVGLVAGIAVMGRAQKRYNGSWLG